MHGNEGRRLNILVVFKKNFEEVHDEGLMALKAILHTVAGDHHQVDYKPREHVRRADFIARDLVIVFGGDGTLTSLSHKSTPPPPSWASILIREPMILKGVTGFTWTLQWPASKRTFGPCSQARPS